MATGLFHGGSDAHIIVLRNKKLVPKSFRFPARLPAWIDGSAHQEEGGDLPALLSSGARVLPSQKPLSAP
ncbi:hypothetical protein NL676_034340, partial [Syzygium grande]